MVLVVGPLGGRAVELVSLRVASSRVSPEALPLLLEGILGFLSVFV